MLTEAAALTAADMTGDVHLGTGLREGEIAGAQTDLGISTEQLTGKRQEHLLQIGKRHVLVDIQSFNLMEETVGTRCDGLVTIHTSRADNADGRLLTFHDTCLNT